ncbi:Homeodomain-like protein [Boletus coccyginus]|nr:Homeodomain-like protein [Boletus coccyginus]
MDEKTETKGVVELGQSALQANMEHLDALKTYTQRLEAELETLDKLLDAVDTIDESDLDVRCSDITIPGAVRATAPIATKELLSPESPFHEDALKRSRYQSLSQVHPMKPKELEALAEAVQAESYRKHALDIQKRSCQTLPNIDAQTIHSLGLSVEGIDWDRIAEKVSAISTTTRTARECEIRWLGEQHPEFNHELWSKEEVLKVKSIAAEFVDSRPDWVAVAQRLGTRRTPLDCMRHATSRKALQWTADADERLLEAIRMYGHDNWYLVARHVSEDATPSQCSGRFEKTLDESIKHTIWSPEEDARLSTAVAAYGSSWVDVAANVPGRHNDQCRDRWIEQVKPGINRSPWSEEEDRILLDYMREYENTSWKEISERLHNGRTEAMCRNRYAVLQKGTNMVRGTPLASPEVLVASVDKAVVPSDSVPASSKTLNFGSSFVDVHSCPTTPAPSLTESHHQNQLVFLEPVVSSNVESQSYHSPHSSRPSTKFKMTTAGDFLTQSTTMPPPKKRKTQSHIARSKKSVKEAQQQRFVS